VYAGRKNFKIITGWNEYNFYPVNLLNGIFEKFWGAGLTLNVDHCGDRRSPIGARAWCNGSTVE